jgi:hypothetical protein
MGLSPSNIGHIYAWICAKTARKISTRNAQEAPTQYSSCTTQKIRYGGTRTHPPDTTPRGDAPRIKIIQQVIGGVLYYARAVDLIVLPALSTVASDQASATETTEAHVQQLLDYLARHPDATIRYHKSDMILNIHSDASYLSETKARSLAAGYFSWAPHQPPTNRLN